jgi:hypothetical protein
VVSTGFHHPEGDRSKLCLKISSAVGRERSRQLAAAMQAFFPGEEGGSAIAGVLSGRVVPSGRLYLSDPLAQVARPVRWLAGFARVPLGPGQARQVTFRLHADRTAFCGRDGARVVEPGEIRVAIGGASDRLVLHGSFTLCGAERPAGADRVLDTPVVIGTPQ